ncbi:hypothetical protein CDL15_Pgr025471 [Punica granatum]|nr:hypothetical protein CDL15_Pgr025471 [Punica granatum]
MKFMDQIGGENVGCHKKRQYVSVNLRGGGGKESPRWAAAELAMSSRASGLTHVTFGGSSDSLAGVSLQLVGGKATGPSISHRSVLVAFTALIQL